MKTQPLFSIVTVCYNAENYIRKTIESIISQKFADIEYIVIDGKSKDRTCGIINEYKNNIDIFISESDYGIYDAMNKAVKLASGQWIYFLNAGDIFSSSEVLRLISKRINKTNAEILFGNIIFKYEWGYVLNITKHFRGKPTDLPINHQSVFVKTELLKKSGFNLTYRIAADHDFLYKQFHDGIKFHHIDYPIAIYDTSGISSYNYLSDKEVFDIHRKYGIHSRCLELYTIIRYFLLSTLPSRILTAWYKRKYQNLLISKNSNPEYDL